MDPAVYTAAMEGDMEKLTNSMGQLNQERTRHENTVLHIATQHGQTEFVEKLLTEMSSSMLSILLPAKNKKGETALHVAAREGHSLIIRALVQQAEKLDKEGGENGLNIVKEILTSVNEDGDTALHEALRTSIVSPGMDGEISALHEEDGMGKESMVPKEQRMTRRITLKRIVTGDWKQKLGTEAAAASALEDVKLLVFPNFAYLANKAGETPLYLAAECESYQMVRKIADSVTGSEANAAGPGDTSALHAAIITDNKENTAFLLKWNKDLARKPDMKGWTPLHYAAEFGHAERVEQLLGFDGSLGYQTTGEKDGENTALHIAARQGHVEVLEELMSGCCGCWDIVNAKGQNMLHVAVESQEPEVVEFFKRSPSLESLLNQKDKEGNTPLHLASRDCDVLEYFSDIDYSTLHKTSYNNENRSALDILAYSGYGSALEKKSMMKRLIQAGIPQVSRNATTIFGKQNKFPESKSGAESAGESTGDDKQRLWSLHLLVSSLVATTTFAAIMSMPGGYNGQEGPSQGVPLLLRKSVIRTFAVTDVLASMTAKHSYDAAIGTFTLGMLCTLSSVIFMMLAFATGSYAMMGPLPPTVVEGAVIFSIFYFGFNCLPPCAECLSEFWKVLE